MNYHVKHVHGIVHCASSILQRSNSLYEYRLISDFVLSSSFRYLSNPARGIIAWHPSQSPVRRLARGKIEDRL